MADRKIKHKGTTNKPSPQGHDYEINILTLSYLDAMDKLRKHRNNFHSYIATEVLDTSPFEDVVYVQVYDGEATSCYVQAKHSLQKFPIKLEELLSDSSKRDKICLTKYFESVRNIKEALKHPNSYYSEIKQRTKFNKESHKFIIFTNRPLHSDVTGIEDTTDDILFYTKENQEGKLYKIIIDDNDPKSIYQRMKDLLMAKVQSVTENEIKEFFNNLIFATDQPNVHKLKQLVEEKLKKITHLPETKWIANTLDKELSQWAHQKDGWFLDRNSELFKYIDQHLASWRQTVCTLNNIDKIREQSIDFRDDIQVLCEVTCFLDQIVTDEPRVCIVYYENLKLTEVKIAQTITDKIKYETVFLHLDHSNNCSSLKLLNILKAFESGGSNLLIITVNLSYELDEILNIISSFFDILERYPHKKIILIVPSHFSTESLKERTTERLKVIKDRENTFLHLNKVSQETILDRTVIFENHIINLRLLVDENLQENINGQLLADFITGGIIIKTTHAMDMFELKNVQDYYIPRQLKRICIKDEILKKKHDFRIYWEGDIFEEAISNNDENDILLITNNKDKSDFDRITIFYESHNIHWLIEENNTLYWHKSQGSVDNIRNYLDIDNIDIDLNEVSLYCKKTGTSEKHETLRFDFTTDIDIGSDDESDDENSIISNIISHISSTSSSSSSTSSSSLDAGNLFQDYFSTGRSIKSGEQSNRIDNIQDIENKIVIVSAEPGMGKSTLLSHFDKVLKSCGEYKEQTILVAKTNLESHSTRFKKLNKKSVTMEDAIDFLIASLHFEDDLIKNKNVGQRQDEEKENNDFISVDEKGKLMLCPHKDINGRRALCLKLFAHFYNDNKIIVLLDGFDETAPEYSNQVLGLLKVLSLTNVQKLVVTTRPCGAARELEHKLNTFSYSLVCFSEQDQLNFLNKFWKHNLNLNEDIKEDKLVYFRNKCEKMLFKNYNTASISNSVFVSIPQNIEMVATVYIKYFQKFLETGECEDMSKDLNLYLLYNTFFQSKFNILHDVSDSDKCKDMIKYGKLRKITKKEHGELAVIELFEEKTVENIIADDRKFELIEAVKSAEEKTGIVYLDSNGAPRFVHRTFAEFFAADLLADLLLLKDTKNHKQYETAQHLVYELFTENLPSSKVIISFLNYKLVSECLNNECNVCNVCLYRDYFHAAINEDWIKLVEIKNIGNVRDPLDRTPLHLGFYSATNIHSITSLLDNQFGNELYIKDNVFNWTAIHYFAMNNNLRDFKGTINLPLSTVVIDNPDLLQDIYGKTPLMHAKERNYKAVNIFANELRFAQHLKDHNGNTSLHYFTDNNLRKYKNDHTIVEHSTKIYQYSRKSCEEFFIHSKMIMKFLIAGCNFFEPNIRGVMPCMQMLREKEYCNILYIIMMHKPVLKLFISEICDDFLNVEWKKQWDYNLTQCARLQDDEGKTILHHSVVADKLFEFGITECFLRHQAVVDGINIQDHEGKTALHHALYDDDKHSIGCIREIPCLIKYGADVTIKDNKGNTPIEMLFNKICTVEFNRDEEFEIFKYLPLDFIIALCQRQCKTEDHRWKSIKVRYFINLSDKYGRTVTHYVVSSGNIEKITSLLKYKPNVNIEDNEGKIPADGIFDNVELLEMLDCQPSLREQLCSMLLSMPKTKTHSDKLLLILGRYKNIAYYLIEHNAINVNRVYGGKTLYNILNNK